MPVLDKLGNIGEGRKLKNLEAIARLVNTFEPEVEDLDDDELRAKTGELQQRAANGESLDDLLPEAFACHARGRTAHDRPTPLRRAADGRGGAAPGQHRRDEDR